LLRLRRRSAQKAREQAGNNHTHQDIPSVRRIRRAKRSTIRPRAIMQAPRSGVGFDPA
jgi:hypothetical protein